MPPPAPLPDQCARRDAGEEKDVEAGPIRTLGRARYRRELAAAGQFLDALGTAAAVRIDSPGRRRSRRDRPGCGRSPCRGRVERDPADAGEPDLDPGVGVGVADAVAAVLLPEAGREPGHHPGRDPLHPKHQGHRPRELLAVAGLVAEEERGQRIVALIDLLVVVVGPAPKLVEDRPDRVVVGRRVPGQPRGKRVHAPVGGAGERAAQLGVGGEAAPKRCGDRRQGVDRQRGGVLIELRLGRQRKLGVAPQPASGSPAARGAAASSTAAARRPVARSCRPRPSAATFIVVVPSAAEGPASMPSIVVELPEVIISPLRSLPTRTCRRSIHSGCVRSANGGIPATSMSVGSPTPVSPPCSERVQRTPSNRSSTCAFQYRAPHCGRSASWCRSGATAAGRRCGSNRRRRRRPRRTAPSRGS